MLNPQLSRITERIGRRSRKSRETYLRRIELARHQTPARKHLSCGNQAHAFAATGEDKDPLAMADAPNIGIVTAYNDMLSAHQPFSRFPELIDAPVCSMAFSYVVGPCVIDQTLGQGLWQHQLALRHSNETVA